MLCFYFIYIILFYYLWQSLMENILPRANAALHCDTTMANKDKVNKVQIQYPCRWLYKVIGLDPERLHQALVEIASDESCTITPSNRSPTGKYHCLNLEVTVRSEAERNSIYTALKAHPQIKIIL